VSYRKGPSLFNSDWALFRHDTQAWQARGHVKLVHGLKSGERIEGSGEKAEFDQTTGRGSLVGAAGGPVSYARFPTEGPPDSGSATRLEWEGQEHIRLTGQVHVWGRGWSSGATEPITRPGRARSKSPGTVPP